MTVPAGGVRSPISAAAGAGLVMLAFAGILAARPPERVAGRPFGDPATSAELAFPYRHLTVTAADDQAKLLLDDGSVQSQTSIAWTVPRNGVARGGDPQCDPEDRICWGSTTVDAALMTRIELEYVGIPCVIAGSPGVRTTLECSEPAGHP